MSESERGLTVYLPARSTSARYFGTAPKLRGFEDLTLSIARGEVESLLPVRPTITTYKPELQRRDPGRFVWNFCKRFRSEAGLTQSRHAFRTARRESRSSVKNPF